MNLQILFPEQTFPQLFEDVMMLRIFPDSKTFADAVPLAPIAEINSKYMKINRADRNQ
jgi:alpha,alpha-trehalase